MIAMYATSVSSISTFSLCVMFTTVPDFSYSFMLSGTLGHDEVISVLLASNNILA